MYYYHLGLVANLRGGLQHGRRVGGISDNVRVAQFAHYNGKLLMMKVGGGGGRMKSFGVVFMW